MQRLSSPLMSLRPLSAIALIASFLPSPVIAAAPLHLQKHGAWEVSCYRDEMSDGVDCSASSSAKSDARNARLGFALFIFYRNGEVRVQASDFDESVAERGWLRVDQNDAREFAACRRYRCVMADRSAEIVEQMLQGKSARVRLSGIRSADAVISLAGVRAAVDDLKKQTARFAPKK